MKLIVTLTLLTFVHGESSHCRKFSTNAAFQDRNTIVDTSSKTLSGTWLSEGCETRPGPEYILRHYSFQGDGKYKLIQHHYWDDSCSSPKLTIISTGLLKTRRDSFLHHDALSGNIKPINISIIPQDFKSAKELDSLVSFHCPGQYWRSWRRYQEHLIYSNTKNVNYKSPSYNFHFQQLSAEGQNYHDRNTQHHLHNSSGDVSCLGSLRWAFNELKLLKVQLRPNSNLITRNTVEMHWELLLGDIPSRQNIREHYIPTAFQVPLVKISKGETIVVKGEKYFVKYSCNICTNLMANKKAPPHLIEKPRLPPFVEGEWTSQRCEVRPLGLYLTRIFSFSSDVWIGEHKFYLDPFCTFPKFIVTAAGNFISGIVNSALDEAFNIDFKIERATLVIFDRSMAHSIQSGTCGEDVWQIGVPQELRLTGGCLPLGILIPSIQYDIVKVEMNYEGSWLLFLGQADTENSPRTNDERPTAFQLPLVKCGDGQSVIGDSNSKGLSFKGNQNLCLYCTLVFLMLLLR